LEENLKPLAVFRDQLPCFGIRPRLGFYSAQKVSADRGLEDRVETRFLNGKIKQIRRASSNAS
jgi:hypothetical protein